jgi:hypothetical protein
MTKLPNPRWAAMAALLAAMLITADVGLYEALRHMLR